VRSIHGCEQLAAVYQRFDGVVKDYQLEPHHLVAYHGNWYLLATNARNRQTEIFALSRFRSVAAQRQRFVRPKEYNPLDFIKNGFGITRGEKPMHVRLWFSPQVATYVKERIWHPSQTVREQPEGAVEIQLTTTGRKELIRWILSWTPDVKVLAPADLRERVLARLEAGCHRQNL
jgi:predicted DNA-binding transcriptional regulator YafY